jgi:hypothetical protein
MDIALPQYHGTTILHTLTYTKLNPFTLLVAPLRSQRHSLIKMGAVGIPVLVSISRCRAQLVGNVTTSTLSSEPSKMTTALVPIVSVVSGMAGSVIAVRSCEAMYQLKCTVSSVCMSAAIVRPTSLAMLVDMID